MNDVQSPRPTVKVLAILICAAIVAVAVTLVQRLVVGNASAAVTGGAVGAVIAVLAVSIMRKKSG
ncbi:MAG: hypothetical protein ACREBG_21750 [Pyrinomonadaceae bacterium]